MSGITAMGGVGGILDTQTVTTGVSGAIPNRIRGYSSGFIGSIIDGTSNIYAGAAITLLWWSENGGGGAEQVALSIPSVANSGWTSININGTVLLRASAVFSSGNWTWNGISTNLFGGAGTVVPVSWSI